MAKKALYNSAKDLYDNVRDEFLDVFPPESSAEEVMEFVDELSPPVKRVVKQLEKNDWLGFDTPSQALDAALGGNINRWEPSQGLKSSLGNLYTNVMGKGFNPNSIAPVTAGSLFALGAIPEQAEASTTPQPLQDLGQAISGVEVPLLGNIFEGTGNYVANMGREEDRMKRVMGAAGDWNLPAALFNIFQ